MTFSEETSPVFNGSVERTAKDVVRISWKTRLQNLPVQR